MSLRSKQILGFTLLLAGLLLGGIGLWLLLSPAQYAATARIKLESSVTNLAGVISYGFDFPQTTFEIIKSRLVLSNVVASLNLNETWGEKYANGSPLKTSECMTIIQNHLRFAAIRNTKFIDVTFYSDDPNEAAGMAKAIVNGYRDYRIQTRNENGKIGLKVFSEHYEMEEAKIREAQTNLDLLREKLGIQNQSNTSDNHSPEQQPYWDEKQKLEQMLEQHKLLKTKIEMMKLDMEMPKNSMVQVFDQAKPPKFPVGPNRFLGAALCFISLFPLTGGILLLKSSRHRIV